MFLISICRIFCAIAQKASTWCIDLRNRLLLWPKNYKQAQNLGRCTDKTVNHQPTDWQYKDNGRKILQKNVKFVLPKRLLTLHRPNIQSMFNQRHQRKGSLQQQLHGYSLYFIFALSSYVKHSLFCKVLFIFRNHPSIQSNHLRYAPKP